MKIVNIVSIVMIVTMLMVSIVSAELTTNAKNWLATNAGSNNCFVSSGITYNDPDGIARTGGTGDVANAFFVAHLVGKDSAIIIASTNYAQLKIINGGADLDINDVGWAYNNDGHIVGTPAYCTSGPIPPVPELNTGILTSVGMLGLFIVSRRYKVKK